MHFERLPGRNRSGHLEYRIRGQNSHRRINVATHFAPPMRPECSQHGSVIWVSQTLDERIDTCDGLFGLRQTFHVYALLQPFPAVGSEWHATDRDVTTRSTGR